MNSSIVHAFNPCSIKKEHNWQRRCGDPSHPRSRSARNHSEPSTPCAPMIDLSAMSHASHKLPLRHMRLGPMPPVPRTREKNTKRNNKATEEDAAGKGTSHAQRKPKYRGATREVKLNRPYPGGSNVNKEPQFYKTQSTRNHR